MSSYLELATTATTFLVAFDMDDCWGDMKENVSLEDAIQIMHEDNIGKYHVDCCVRIATMQGNKVDMLVPTDSRKYQDCSISGLLIRSDYETWANEYLNSDGESRDDYDDLPF